MRKLKLFLGLIFLFCLVTPLYAVSYIQVTNEPEMAQYLDVDSVWLEKGYVTAWIKTVPKKEYAQQMIKELKNKNFSHFMSCEAFDIDVMQSQILELVYYDKNIKTLSSDSSHFSTYKYERVVPGSIGEYIYETVMKVAAKKYAK